MKIVSLSAFKRFWNESSENAESVQACLAWYQHIRTSDLSSLTDGVNCDHHSNGLATFKISEARYRIVVWINHAFLIANVRFVGTAIQYEKLDITSLVNSSGKAVDIKPIKTEEDYRAALDMINSLMLAEPDSKDGEKLDVLTTLVEAFETKNYPMDFPDAVEAIKFEMERQGLTVRDLEPMIGKRNRVYEILNHKRTLSLKMIWNLHTQLGIPAESLIKPPKARTHA